ncbi:MAG: hypothetical protein GWN62_24875 [Aliifodinibius sp.]|nr:hypothetical protein [Fodinibius sp.]
MIFKRMLSKEWGFTTILVILGVALCVRLGIWQLDRLEQRRTFNAHVREMWEAEKISLPEEIGRFSLEEMEYRSVVVSGTYDYESQVALRNQYHENRFGYHLLTPLKIGEGIAVLVDRGWIPAEGNELVENWDRYHSGTGYVVISGIIRLGQDQPDVGGRADPTLAPDETYLAFWNNVNIDRLVEQMPYELLDIYVQLDPGNHEDDSFPIPFQPEIKLTEGPHLGYAGQWFTFATILLIGYPFFIKKKEEL